jgi:hypothetical protein
VYEPGKQLRKVVSRPQSREEPSPNLEKAAFFPFMVACDCGYINVFFLSALENGDYLLPNSLRS